MFGTEHSFTLTYRSLPDLPYEPHRHGFFPAFHRHWFTYRFFFSLEDSIDTGTNPLRALHEARCRAYRISPEKPDPPTWYRFRAAVWVWFRTIGSGWEAATSFSCPECAKLPVHETIWIVDGTMRVSVKRWKLAHCAAPHGKPPGRSGAAAASNGGEGAAEAAVGSDDAKAAPDM